MSDIWYDIRGWLATGQAHSILRAVVILVVGLIVAKLVTRWLRSKRLQAQAQMILRRVVSYFIIVVAVIWALRELGFQLGALLGAAGLFTVAVGFAARTSISNLISGIFLIGERPFVVGDAIKVGEITGTVLSVDLMSTKVKTFDGLLVRIPNETLIKTNVTNLTHFPIRRVDIKLGVAYKEDIGKVRKLLEGVADKIKVALEEPKPLFIFLGYGDSALEMQFSVWGRKEKFLELRNALLKEIKSAFDENGIEIPFPHRSLYTGEVTEPFPVRIVAGDPSPGPAEESKA